MVGVGSDAVRMSALGWWRNRVGMEGGEGGEGLSGGGSPGVGIERAMWRGVTFGCIVMVRGGGSPRGVGVGSAVGEIGGGEIGVSKTVEMDIGVPRGARGGLSNREREGGMEEGMEKDIGVPRGASGGLSKLGCGASVAERLRGVGVGVPREELRGVARGRVHAPPFVAEGCGGGRAGGVNAFGRGRAGRRNWVLYLIN